MDGNGERLVITTFAGQEAAAAFGRRVVEKRLAACATCLPGGLSFFHWQGEGVSAEAETLLIIKTHKDKLVELERYFEQEHPYDVPEFIVLTVEGISAAYGNWLRQELKLNIGETA